MLAGDKVLSAARAVHVAAVGCAWHSFARRTAKLCQAQPTSLVIEVVRLGLRLLNGGFSYRRERRKSRVREKHSRPRRPRRTCISNVLATSCLPSCCSS